MNNIEKSAFRKGEYIGYANGVWRIVRRSPYEWSAEQRETCRVIRTRSLAEMSMMLAQLVAQGNDGD